MAKRLTATEKWIDPWFCGLNPQDKLFWVYLCDNCDHAGIWKVNWPLVKFHLGEYQFDKIVFNGRIDFLDDETWFLRKFVFFQQKINSIEELNPANKCHLSIINILSSKGLTSPKEAPIKGLARGQGIGIGIGKGNKGVVRGGFAPPTKEEILAYKQEISGIQDPDSFLDFYESKGWMIGHNKMKSWKAAYRRACREWDSKVKQPDPQKPKRADINVKIAAMKADKTDPVDIKFSLLKEYSESEIDTALGQKY